MAETSTSQPAATPKDSGEMRRLESLQSRYAANHKAIKATMKRILKYKMYSFGPVE